MRRALLVTLVLVFVGSLPSTASAEFSVSRKGFTGRLIHKEVTTPNSPHYAVCAAYSGNVRELTVARVSVTRTRHYRRARQFIRGRVELDVRFLNDDTGTWQISAWGPWRGVRVPRGYIANLNGLTWSLPHGFQWAIAWHLQWWVRGNLVGRRVYLFDPFDYDLQDARSVGEIALQGPLTTGDVEPGHSSWCQMP
jgi:hypothetical protein